MYSDDAGYTRPNRWSRPISPRLPPCPLFVPIVARFLAAHVTIFPRLRHETLSLFLSLRFRALLRSCARIREQTHAYVTAVSRVDERARARAHVTWPDRQFGGMPISHDDARTCTCVRARASEQIADRLARPTRSVLFIEEYN